MVTRQRMEFFGLLLSGLWFAGCSSNAALQPANSRREASSTALRSAPVPPIPTVAKAAPRESAFAQYSNPDYGVTFRFPRNFALQEGSPEDTVGVRTQDDLQREEPGGVLIATVVVPDDAYPNTTFAGALLQFAVNRYLTAGSCRQNLLSRIGDSNGHTGSATMEGVDFAVADADEGDANTEFFERDYSGFTNGTCYEFFLRVGVSPGSDGTRLPDEKKIMARLEKIISSLQFDSKPISLLDGPPSGQALRRKQL